MANDLNQCTFTGRLGADPEVKSFQNGGRICNLRLAVGEQWKDKNSGEKKERTEWVSVTIQSDGLVGIAERYLRKGSRILVQGKQQTRKWQDQSGNDRYSTECVLFGFDAKLIMLDGSGGNQTEGQRGNGGGQGGRPKNDGGGFPEGLDDDVPFLRCDTVW
jgi:single-strand DNA-binding protein